MRLVATYPIQADVIHPFCGQTVLAQTIHGDVIVGVLDGVKDGMAYFKPLSLPQASVQQVRKRIRQQMKGKRKANRRHDIVILNRDGKAKAKTAGFGYPWYGFGGFGRFGGLGAGLALALPLFLLTALFVSPFL